MSVKSSKSRSPRTGRRSLDKVRICELSHIHSIDQVYDRLQECLHLPQYFGRNLDALYDSLSTEVRGPFKIVWRDHPNSAMDLGEIYYEGLLDIFRAVADERDDVELELD